MNTEANTALDVLDALVIVKLQDVQRFTLMIKVYTCVFVPIIIQYITGYIQSRNFRRI